jgi:Flavodoxins
MLLLFPGCTKAQTNESTTKDTSKMLIVYYSRTGNTEAMANRIQELTGADMFRVETVKPYPSDYTTTTEVAKEEKNNNARPTIKAKVENIDQYDTVYIGFPIWWGTYPMAMATFIEGHNLKGKTIIPFCTHGGGGVDQGFIDVKKRCPDSDVLDGLSIAGNSVKSKDKEIEEWVLSFR